MNALILYALFAGALVVVHVVVSQKPTWVPASAPAFSGLAVLFAWAVHDSPLALGPWVLTGLFLGVQSFRQGHYTHSNKDGSADRRYKVNPWIETTTDEGVHSARLGLLVLVVAWGLGTVTTAREPHLTVPPPSGSSSKKSLSARGARSPKNKCGSTKAKIPGGLGVAAWRTHSCQSRSEAGARWSDCYRRAAYTKHKGLGCPGDERCCPGR